MGLYAYSLPDVDERASGEWDPLSQEPQQTHPVVQTEGAAEKYTCIHTHGHTHTHSYTRTHSYTWTHSYMHTHRALKKKAKAQTRTHTHTYIHTPCTVKDSETDT